MADKRRKTVDSLRECPGALDLPRSWYWNYGGRLRQDHGYCEIADLLGL